MLAMAYLVPETEIEPLFTVDVAELQCVLVHFGFKVLCYTINAPLHFPGHVQTCQPYCDMRKDDVVASQFLVGFAKGASSVLASCR